MKRCFAYIRVSTVKQGDGVSLEAQKDAILAFASRHGLAVTQWFEEKETAAKKGRPVFNQMVSLLQRRKADGLIVHKIDRSARNFADWAKIGDLADAGIDIHFATESLDFRSRGGRLAADVQAVVAADYVRNLREECIKGLNGRLKQGLYPFKAPIGYLDNGGGKPKTLDPVRAPLIKRAFELYASGRHSQRSLQLALKRMGLRTQQGRPLSRTGLETALKNPFYCGIIQIKRSGATYPGIHEPLISVALFDAVTARREGRTVQKVTKHDFTYRRLFRCADCCGPMIPERQKGHVYYRCQKKDCATKTVREEAIEAAIEQCLGGVTLHDADVAVAVKRVQSWQPVDQEGFDTKAIELQRAAIKDRLNRLTDALIDRLIDQDAFNQRKQALLLEEARLNESERRTSDRREYSERLPEFLELIKSLGNLYRLSLPAEKQQIVEIATSNLRVCRKNIYVEPSNWLLQVEQTVSALCGPHYRTTDRTAIDKSISDALRPDGANIEKFVERMKEIQGNPPRSLFR
jgi:site-specific DNA recombinase